jgi:ABC-type dipeptide/oligopeptide/nickel transport system permease subunit
LKQNKHQFEQNLSESLFKKVFRHKLGRIGLSWIFLCLILALSGSLFIPDTSPNASRINLHASFLSPGSEAKILFPKKRTTSFFKKWMFGNESAGEAVIYNDYEVSKSELTLFYTHPDWKEGERQPVYNQKLTEAADCLNVILKNTGDCDEIRVKNIRFILGTDNLGRDVFSRLVLGTRISFLVGFVAVFISFVLGSFLGLMAGYYRGWIDKLVMWFAGVIWSLPTLLLVLAVSFALGKGFWQIFIAIGLSTWVEMTRVVRGEVMSIKEKEYIQAARVLGFSDLRILFKHVFPNTLNSVIVICTANFASAILLEAGLSFLGLGVKPPVPSWGMMINEYFGYIVLDKAYLGLIPGFAIMFLVVAFNFAGIALRDVLYED